MKFFLASWFFDSSFSSHVLPTRIMCFKNLSFILRIHVIFVFLPIRVLLFYYLLPSFSIALFQFLDHFLYHACMFMPSLFLFFSHSLHLPLSFEFLSFSLYFPLSCILSSLFIPLSLSLTLLLFLSCDLYISLSNFLVLPLPISPSIPHSLSPSHSPSFSHLFFLSPNLSCILSFSISLSHYLSFFLSRAIFLNLPLPQFLLPLPLHIVLLNMSPNLSISLLTLLFLSLNNSLVRLLSFIFSRALSCVISLIPSLNFSLVNFHGFLSSLSFLLSHSPSLWLRSILCSLSLSSLSLSLSLSFDFIPSPHFILIPSPISTCPLFLDFLALEMFVFLPPSSSLSWTHFISLNFSLPHSLSISSHFASACSFSPSLS